MGIYFSGNKNKTSGGCFWEHSCSKHWPNGGTTDLKSLLEINRDNTQIFVWNGGVGGCADFLSEAKELGHKDISIVEQGLVPQHSHLRFLSKPVGEEVNLSQTETPSERFVEWLRATENGMAELEEYVYDCLSLTSAGLYANQPPRWKGGRIRSIKNKVVIVMQLAHDASLSSLEKPEKQFMPLMVDKLKEIYGDNYNNLDIVLCPHPKDRKGGRRYYRGCIEKYRWPKQISTTEQCIDAELVIGYNSTILYELALRDIPVVAIYKNHPLNFNNNKWSLAHKIRKSQFNPWKDTLTEILNKKKLCE